MLIAGDSLEIKRGYNGEKCTSFELGDNRGEKKQTKPKARLVIRWFITGKISLWLGQSIYNRLTAEEMSGL